VSSERDLLMGRQEFEVIAIGRWAGNLERLVTDRHSL